MPHEDAGQTERWSEQLPEAATMHISSLLEVVRMMERDHQALARAGEDTPEARRVAAYLDDLVAAVLEGVDRQGWLTIPEAMVLLEKASGEENLPARSTVTYWARVGKVTRVQGPGPAGGYLIERDSLLAQFRRYLLRKAA